MVVSRVSYNLLGQFAVAIKYYSSHSKFFPKYWHIDCLFSSNWSHDRRFTGVCRLLLWYLVVIKLANVCLWRVDRQSNEVESRPSLLNQTHKHKLPERDENRYHIYVESTWMWSTIINVFLMYVHVCSFLCSSFLMKGFKRSRIRSRFTEITSLPYHSVTWTTYMSKEMYVLFLHVCYFVRVCMWQILLPVNHYWCWAEFVLIHSNISM